MIVFLYGENAYDSKVNLREIVSKYKEKHKESVNFFEFNFDADDEWGELKSAVQTMPLFQDKKLIVVKNVFSSERAGDFKELLEKNNLAKDNDVFLAIWERLSGKNLKPASFLLKDKSVKQKEFHLPTGRKMENWAKKEFAKNGLIITKTALYQLVVFVNGDLLRLAGEIDKLTAFKRGGTISEKDIDLLVVPEMEQSIFRLTDAILAENKDKALSVLENHIARAKEKRKEWPILLGLIASQFRNLVVIKDFMDRGVSVPQIASKAGIHPFVVKKSVPALRRFSLDRLKMIYDKLSSLDITLKSKSVNPLLLFDLFILSV